MRTPRRAAFGFVWATVALDMLALGVTIPVMPELVSRLAGGDHLDAATVYGAFGTLFALMQFFFAPVLGTVSDGIGRRPVILASNAGLGLSYVCMALAPSLGWLFAARLVAGCTSASVPTAGAYIADVSTAEQRAGRFGLLGAAFGLGFILGPAMGGLLGEMDVRLPFWVAGALSLLNATYGYFVLPESLPADRRQRFTWDRANPLGTLAFFREHRALPLLAIISFLGYVAHEVLPSVFVLYASAEFDWSSRDVGLVFALVGTCMAVVQGALVGPVVRKLGERRTLALGLGLGCLGMATYGLAGSGHAFLWGIPAMAAWGVAGPAAQGLMSRAVEPEHQGQLQGATASLRGIGAMLGPSLFTMTYADAVARFGLPGAPFLLAALLLAVALGLVALVADATPTSPDAGPP